MRLGGARGPVRLRYVWYGMLLQLPLVLGFQAYRWRCSACKKMYTDYPAGVVAYSRHSVALMYEMMDYLRGSSIAEVSRRYHIAEQTASNMLLRAVRITPDWDSLRRERELHLVVDEHSCAGKELVITVCEARTTQIRRLGRSAGHGGLMAAGRKGNEAVAPPIIDCYGNDYGGSPARRPCARGAQGQRGCCPSTPVPLYGEFGDGGLS